LQRPINDPCSGLHIILPSVSTLSTAKNPGAARPATIGHNGLTPM